MIASLMIYGIIPLIALPLLVSAARTVYRSGYHEGRAVGRDEGWDLGYEYRRRDAS